MNEVEHQRKVIQDFKAAFPKAYAIKMSNRFLAGIPDLMLKAPGHDILFVEMKVTDYKKKGFVNVDTTRIQQETMAKMGMAGIRCEVWVVVTNDDDLYMLRVPPEATRVECSLVSLAKKEKRGPWPIVEFINNPVRIYT
jgi:hypothetical protein